MAGELSLSVKFDYAKGDIAQRVDLTDSVTVTSTSFLHHIQNVGTSEEAVNLGDVAAGGYALFRNLDATNYISLSDATGTGLFIRMLAGEFALFRLDDAATAPFAVADTSACDMEVWLLDL